MLDSFTADTFLDRRGEAFHLKLDDGSVVATELIDVSVADEDRAGAGRTPFSLVFRAPPELMLPQRIYALEHAELGAFELFLVPIGGDEAGVRYEAVFT